MGSCTDLLIQARPSSNERWGGFCFNAVVEAVDPPAVGQGTLSG
jgi:hypothetical protein